MSDRHAGSNIDWGIGNQTGGFNQKSTKVYAQNPGEDLPGISTRTTQESGDKEYSFVSRSYGGAN